MKNLLKLSLLLSALVASSLNATLIEVNGRDRKILDQITLVNDLGVNAKVNGKVLASGSKDVLEKPTLQSLNGAIKVENMSNGKAGYITYDIIPAGYRGIVRSRFDFKN